MTSGSLLIRLSSWVLNVSLSEQGAGFWLKCGSGDRTQEEVFVSVPGLSLSIAYHLLSVLLFSIPLSVGVAHL